MNASYTEKQTRKNFLSFKEHGLTVKCWFCVAFSEGSQDTSNMSATTCNGHSVIMLNGAKVIGNIRRMTKGCITWRGTKTFEIFKEQPQFLHWISAKMYFFQWEVLKFTAFSHGRWRRRCCRGSFGHSLKSMHHIPAGIVVAVITTQLLSDNDSNIIVIITPCEWVLWGWHILNLVSVRGAYFANETTCNRPNFTKYRCNKWFEKNTS